jgi:hypothetical protein
LKLIVAVRISSFFFEIIIFVFCFLVYF